MKKDTFKAKREEVKYCFEFSVNYMNELFSVYKLIQKFQTIKKIKNGHDLLIQSI